MEMINGNNLPDWKGRKANFKTKNKKNVKSLSTTVCSVVTKIYSYSWNSNDEYLRLLTLFKWFPLIEIVYV
jgi:hypothetical protein